MKLLKVGRDASCDIVLHSEKVSSLHAEITILGNGDILLEDKGSRNGTFLMNNPIKPGTAVTVRRGDMIRFADVELQWGLVPMPENNSNFKALFGIGTNFRNEIQVSGNTVSRFHATLKIGKDGKAYLQDHSKNGTTVNGLKIAKNQNVRIRRKDAVVCGGVPVDLSKFIPADVWKKVLVGVAAAAVLVGLVFGLSKLFPGWGESQPKEYIPSVAYVRGFYHYKVKIVNDPFVEIMKELGVEGYSNEYAIGKDEDGNFGFIMKNDRGEYIASPIGYEGTAFFISRDGKLMTNRHVACPWEYADEREKVTIDQAIRNLMEHLLPVNSLRTSADIEAFNSQNFPMKPYLYKLYQLFKYDHTKLTPLIAGFKNSPIEIEGVSDDLLIGYANHNYTSINEFEHCTLVEESGNADIDLAILQLNNKRTPETISKVVELSRAVVDPAEINPLEESYYYIGYPMGVYLNLNNQDGGLRPLLNEVKANRTPGKYEFDLQGEVLGGASGSPILDRHGRLVGVVNKSMTFTTMSKGVLAKYAQELFHKVERK